MFNVDSVTFDLTNCSLKEQDTGMKGWMNSEGIAHKIRLFPSPRGRPHNWTFDLTNADAAAAFYSQQCAENHGAMLSSAVTTAGGVEVLQGIFKYRAPLPGSMAMYFVGILYVPFQTCCYQINIEAMEMGTTGIREATVMIIEQPERPADAPEPIMLEDGEDLFDRMLTTPLSKLPADDQRWDETFPDHPLSLVRARLANVIDTLHLDPEVQALPPFRIAGVPSDPASIVVLDAPAVGDVRKWWRFWER